MPITELAAKNFLTAKNKKLALPEYISAVATSPNPDECVRAIVLVHNFFFPERTKFLVSKSKKGVLDQEILRLLSKKSQPWQYASSIKNLYCLSKSSFVKHNIMAILVAPKPQVILNRIIAITEVIKKSKQPKQAIILAQRLQSCGNFVYYPGLFSTILASEDKEVFFKIFDGLMGNVSRNVSQRIFNVRNAKSLVKISDPTKFIDNIRLLYHISEEYLTEQNITALCVSEQPEHVIMRAIISFLQLHPQDIYMCKLNAVKNELRLLRNSDVLSLSVSGSDIPIDLLAFDVLLKNKKESEDVKYLRDAMVPGESAERSDLISKEKFISSKLFDIYGPVLRAEPYNNRLCLIERKIRESILEQIHDNANEEIKSFINANKIELINGINQELIARARSLFSSNSDVNHIAWRCYDKDAPVLQYKNLFVQQEQVYDIYSGIRQRISNLIASDQIRKKAALYYLAAIDESTDELRSTKTDRIKKFIYSLAEIRRGNNTDEEVVTIDKPSCYPGTLTRLAEAVNCHPLFKKNENPEMIVKNIIKAEVSAELNKIIINPYFSSDIKIKYFCSCCVLGLENAKEIILGTEDFRGLDYFDFDFSIQEAVKIRADLLRRISFNSILNKVTSRLLELDIVFDAEKIYYLCVKNLLDLKGLGLTLSNRQIQQIYPKPVPASQPLVVILSRRGSRVGTRTVIDDLVSDEVVSGVELKK